MLVDVLLRHGFLMVLAYRQAEQVGVGQLANRFGMIPIFAISVNLRNDI